MAQRAARRHAPLLVALALLVGSAAAFGVAERLKVERSPVAGTTVDKVFSPTCRCPQLRAMIAFRLRRADRLRVSLLDDEGREIRTLVEGERAAKGRREFFWNGRDNDGRLLPEGNYRPKVELGRADRTIVLPNPIRLDVTAPVVKVVSVRPRAISPDGDGHGDIVRIRYRANERGQGILFVNGRQRVVSRSQRTSGVLQWVGGAPNGAKLPPGRYRLSVRARDLAGNLSTRVPAGIVPLRYLMLDQRRVVTRPGELVRLEAEADAPRVTWFLRRGSSIVQRGTARRLVRFRAPDARGRYVLVASAAGHSARALLLVRAP
jgi:flagellar hook assembly protein FlgD